MADDSMPEHTTEETQPTIWEDPSVPVGDAPPRPHWPVAVTGMMWVGWIGFLAYMLMRSA